MLFGQVCVCVDLAEGRLTVSIASRWQGDGSVSRGPVALYTATAPCSGPVSPVFSMHGSTVFEVNYGNEPFAVQPPNGAHSIRR